MDSIKTVVIQASTTFYTTQDKEQRKKAEEWLETFKKSLNSWYITDQLLHTEKNEQVLFFAAQTIRNKIQYDFHELPVTSHEVSIVSLVDNKVQVFTRFHLQVSKSFISRTHGKVKYMQFDNCKDSGSTLNQSFWTFCFQNHHFSQIYIALADLIMLMPSWQRPIYDLLIRCLIHFKLVRHLCIEP